jgi:hypothetical protein
VASFSDLFRSETAIFASAMALCVNAEEIFCDSEALTLTVSRASYISLTTAYRSPSLKRAWTLG